MDKERLQIISTLVVTVVLIVFAYKLLLIAFDIARTSDRVSPETLVAIVGTLATTILGAVVARWLTQGAQQASVEQAKAVFEAQASVQSRTRRATDPQ